MKRTRCEHETNMQVPQHGLLNLGKRIAFQSGWLLVIFGSLLITGCRGCNWYDYFTRPLTEEEQRLRENSDKEKKIVEKRDFLTRTPILLPGYFPPPHDPELEQKRLELPPDMREAMDELGNPALRFNRFKTGHWAEVQFMVMANNNDTDGQLSSYPVTPMMEPIPVYSTPFYPLTRRPVSLTKGEWKYLETNVFFPRRERRTVSGIVNFIFDRGPGSIPYISMIQGTQLMRTHEYHVVILSERPSNYDYIKMVDTIAINEFSEGLTERETFYHVVPAVVGEPAPLSRNGLTWTTIAYLIWDDYDPSKLSREQQTALLDWLHFGGQLIVSGPDGLERLQQSFLGPFLPTRAAGSRNLTNADFVALNENWSIPLPDHQAGGQRSFEVSERTPLIGVDFAAHVEADFIEGAGELAIERQVGRGRIVVTAFSLNSDLAKRWRGFPSFFNSALFRRPARSFIKKRNGIGFQWLQDTASVFDPLIGSTLRFAARDLSLQGTDPISAEYVFSFENDTNMSSNSSLNTGPRYFGGSQDEEFMNRPLKKRNLDHFQYYGGYDAVPESGVAGWNDDSAISRAARQTLVEAAGIVPPSSGFVLRMLAGYLIVLVPLNWLVFWMLGRVEWAWIAVPIIAVVGAVVVVKSASLDIGFVRSNTQVGVLEVYAGYSRGHASEYSALYTSLSTRYQADLDNFTAQILPLPGQINATSVKREQSSEPVLLQKDVVNRLGGFQIQSNSTGLLHHEYLADLGGALTAQFNQQGEPTGVKNNTSISIGNAGVLWKNQAGQVMSSWLGELPTGTQAKLEFSPAQENDLLNSWRTIPLFSSLSRFCQMIWLEAGLETNQAMELDTLLSLEPMQQFKGKIEPAFRINQFRSIDDPTLINISELEFALAALGNSEDLVGLGRILDAIESLELNVGEVRLIGSTDRPIGKHRFIPTSTRTDQQTLVLVHLRRPRLPSVQRDANAMMDFIEKSPAID